MKWKSKTLNLNALKYHLGMPRGMARAMDDVASTINTKLNSISCDYVESTGKWTYSVDPVNEVGVTCLKGKHNLDQSGEKVAGIVVRYFTSAEDVPYITIAVPFALLKKGAPDKGHVVYHIGLFSGSRAKLIQTVGSKESADYAPAKGQADGYDSHMGGNVPCYIGKTSRGMAQRFKEHTQSVLKGVNTTFYSVWSGQAAGLNTMYPVVQVVDWTEYEEAAYEREEHWIGEYSDDPQWAVLNSVHSRKYLEKLFEKFPELRNQPISAEEAEELLAMRSATTKGLWADAGYAEAVICNNPNNLGAVEVRLIRTLGLLGQPAQAIANTTERKVDSIKNVLSGKTYGRIRT